MMKFPSSPQEDLLSFKVSRELRKGNISWLRTGKLTGSQKSASNPNKVHLKRKMKICTIWSKFSTSVEPK